MFTRIVTILKSLMGYPSTQVSAEPMEVQPLSAKRSPVQSGQASPKAVRKPRPRKSSPAPTPRKPKTEAAQPTTAARKPGKKKPTARQVAMVSQSKPTGSKSATPARKTRQHAK